MVWRPGWDLSPREAVLFPLRWKHTLVPGQVATGHHRTFVRVEESGDPWAGGSAEHSGWAPGPHPVFPRKAREKCWNGPSCYIPQGGKGAVLWVAQSCMTLCNPVDCSPPGSPVHGDSPGRNTCGLPCPLPGDLPNPEIELRSPAWQADSLPSEPLGKPRWGGIDSVFYRDHEE